MAYKNKMLIILSHLIFASFVYGCSDCFSNCPNTDKTSCLATCGCPVFSAAGVAAGVFAGSAGPVHVPAVSPALANWLDLEFGCSLACAAGCSSQHLDSALEACLQDCGCSNLMMAEPSSQTEQENSCNSLCRGSGDGCVIDCMKHFGENVQWYNWLGLGAVLAIGVAAVVMLKNKKDDDYIRM
jgi:hypothetical protein